MYTCKLPNLLLRKQQALLAKGRWTRSWEWQQGIDLIDNSVIPQLTRRAEQWEWPGSAIGPDPQGSPYAVAKL